MKTKIIQIVPAIFAFLAVGLRYFSNWCIDSIPSCYGTWLHSITFIITRPLYFYALSLLPITIILAFVPRTIFQSWLRLAAWLVPVSLVAIFITPVTSNSWMPLYFVSREEMAWYLGLFFAAASLVLIIYKTLAARRNAN